MRAVDGDLILSCDIPLDFNEPVLPSFPVVK